MDYDTEPKYCPFGCGETLLNSLVSDLEWKMFIHTIRHEPKFTKESAVISKCSKCGFILISGKSKLYVGKRTNERD